MVVCKYFQDGYCRYGQNCRYEHKYGSKFNHVNTPASSAASDIDASDEQLVTQVHADIEAAVKGGQWLLSVYAPYKERPNVPGLIDLSPEEARTTIYEAMSKNNLEEAVAAINYLFKVNKQRYEQLLTNSSEIIKVLRSLYKGEAASAPFNGAQNTFGAQPDASSLFRGALQNQNTSPFAQNNQAQSIFAQANKADSAFNQGFGQTAAQSIFSQASQSPFGAQPAQNQSPFGAADTAKSIFAQANRSPFESAPQSTPFKSPFEQPSPFADNTGNVFQKSEPSSIFGQANNAFQQTPLDDAGVYSNEKDLSQDDIDMFKADSFKLGFIPEMPPPHSLCI